MRNLKRSSRRFAPQDDKVKSMEQDTGRIPDLLKRYGVVIGLFIVGVVFFLYGLMQFSAHASPDDVTFQTQPTPQTTLTLSPTDTAEIVVDIEGAVMHPGVYHLESNSRLQDLLTKAGGYVATVDHEKVAKGFNLAEKLTDGAKVYVPFVGEAETATVGQQTPIQSGQTVLGVSSNASGLININTASNEELDSLPGVGTVTAGKIISNRPYTTIEDLLTKKVVGQSTFDKLKDKITIQ